MAVSAGQSCSNPRGFDEALYPSHCIEDIELGARLIAAGRRLALDPQIRVTHLKYWTPRPPDQNRHLRSRLALDPA